MFAKLRCVVAVLALSVAALAQSETLDFELRSDLVYLDAEEVSLARVMQVIVADTGIAFDSSETLAKPVSLRLYGLTMDDAIVHMLANYSYIISYTRRASSIVEVTGIRVLRQISDAPIVAHIEVAPSGQDGAEAASPFRRFDRGWFREALADAEYVAGEIAIEGQHQHPDAMDPRLIVASDAKQARVASIAPGSVFELIGLKSGDEIQDVNGMRVSSSADLVRALDEASRENNMVRIARITADEGQLEPIYIDLESPPAE